MGPKQTKAAPAYDAAAASMAPTAAASASSPAAAAPRPVGVLTGFTGEIGFEIAKGLVSSGAELLLPVRSEAKAAPLVTRLLAETGAPPSAVTLFPGVDLTSPRSIAQFTDDVATGSSRTQIDFLVNNAAITSPRRVTTDDGVELMFAVNVRAYHAMMERLACMLERDAGAPPGRIVNVASDLVGDVDVGDLQFERRRFSLGAAYKQSKAADRMLTAHAAARYAERGIIAHSCHPGVVTSPLLQAIMGSSSGRGWDSAADAARTPVFLALAPEVAAGESGRYWVKCRPQLCQFRDRTAEAERIWSVCDSLGQLTAPLEKTRSGSS